MERDENNFEHAEHADVQKTVLPLGRPGSQASEQGLTPSLSQLSALEHRHCTMYAFSVLLYILGINLLSRHAGMNLHASAMPIHNVLYIVISGDA